MADANPVRWFWFDESTGTAHVSDRHEAARAARREFRVWGKLLAGGRFISGRGKYVRADVMTDAEIPIAARALEQARRR